MKKLSFIILILLSACVQVPVRPDPLASKRLEIEAVVPQSSDVISQTSRMALLFSQPIDRSTVTDQSVLLIHGEVATQTDYDISTLYSSIARQRLEQIPLQFSFSKNGKLLLIQPSDALAEGETYTFLVTSQVLSRERLPLTQDIARLPLKVSYQVVATPRSASTNSTPELNEEMIHQLISTNEIDSSPPVADPTAPTTPEVLPETPGDSSSGISPPPQPQPSGVDSSPSPSSPPAEVVINEIFYDAVGSDTDGVVFVELFGAANTSLNHFKINFVNGSDGNVYDSITLPETARLNAQGFYVIADARTGSPTLTQVAHADLVDSFDPQNGPDALQLLDASDRLLDAVGYGEGIVSQAANHLPTFESVAAPDVVNGHSLERVSPGQDTGNNSLDFIDRPQPTPGE